MRIAELSAVEIINSSPHLILLCPVRDYDCHEVRLRDDDFLRVQVGVGRDDGQDIFLTECGHAIVVNGRIPDKIIYVPQFLQ